MLAYVQAVNPGKYAEIKDQITKTNQATPLADRYKIIDDALDFYIQHKEEWAILMLILDAGVAAQGAGGAGVNALRTTQQVRSYLRPGASSTGNKFAQASTIESRIASGTSGFKNVKIVGHEDDFYQITALYKGTQVEFQAYMHLDGNILVVKSLDFSGAVGTAGFRKAVGEFGKHMGVTEVHVTPAMRSTGANPGHTPAPFIIKVK